MMFILRCAAGLALAGLFVAMLGPFQGAEENLGLDDKSAHVIGFFIITACLTLLFPKLGLWRTAFVAIALGAGVEVVQGLTGRSANLYDLLADSIGVALASLTRVVVQRIRPGLVDAG
ncbi:VanZ family protein [Brevundimonas nasdae]|jgi:VanZ family protein|uniref:VanZ family protein n=2 Tax=Brevundimonas nasdae TaxID=172043 RepID=UPI00191480F7|nr:VanZ family protein [Brevundimonas nasdae]MBK6023517.1 VanZ family protein [Brevundimonas nasdae]MDQ0450168.1 VanZ family protein [Brevundimonas nasdae]